ncbi:Serine/threonine-protein kinase pim-3 [Labeo rohita]|uniref:non-specific serine/threonine protein kinase n=1 Tax=Labeo rohita TaxID=84645 RepID=A0ABQ8LJZ7_LABRO|nr:Serine/threonine-protein kinase pim-3 [Labeo rohita]
MGQRFSRVTSVDDGEVYDYHRSTPPKPGTDKAEQHPHPRDEPPVDAGEEGALRIEEEVRREEERREEERREKELEVQREEKLDVRREEETREELELRKEEERKEEELERRGGDQGRTREVQREDELEVRKEETREEELEVQGEEQRKEEEKKKRKKRFWRLPSFLKAARKHLKRICHGQTKEQLTESPSPASSTNDDIMSRYKLGDRLGVGGFGVVYEASRVEDGLKVAVKDVMKTHDMEYLTIIALTLLANKGPSAPEIIKLLEWQEQWDSYIMVLECPSPCEDLVSLLEGNGGRLSEGLVRDIMQQATQAARTCCRRGVFHGDIKLENFLMSKDTLQVKLIDFGCGDLMRKSAYTTLYGTMEYYPPEYRVKGKYHAKSALSWSLGVILFTMLCGRFPTAEDLQKTELKLWSEPGLSKDCCHLICSLLQHKPKRRLSLGKILRHDWSPYKWWSSNPRHFPSLLSALSLAGWQEDFPSLHKALVIRCLSRHSAQNSAQNAAVCPPPPKDCSFWEDDIAGRKTFHPSVKPLCLTGPAGHGCILRHGLKQQYLHLSNAAFHQAAARSGEDPSPRLVSDLHISRGVKELQPQTFPQSPVSFVSSGLAGRPPTSGPELPATVRQVCQFS